MFIIVYIFIRIDYPFYYFHLQSYYFFPKICHKI